jgi:hypothetical protein
MFLAFIHRRHIMQQIPQVVGVACGHYHSAAITRDGSVLVWGKGNCGQLGLGDYSSSYVPRYLSSLNLEKAVQVACGAVHTLGGWYTRFHIACMRERM